MARILILVATAPVRTALPLALGPAEGASDKPAGKLATERGIGEGDELLPGDASAGWR
jgi:hypothetical protein